MGACGSPSPRLGSDDEDGDTRRDATAHPPTPHQPPTEPTGGQQDAITTAYTIIATYLVGQKAPPQVHDALTLAQRAWEERQQTTNNATTTASAIGSLRKSIQSLHERTYKQGTPQGSKPSYASVAAQSHTGAPQAASLLRLS
jgi:hypothetical protein